MLAQVDEELKAVTAPHICPESPLAVYNPESTLL
jgi:hypothetical protein